MSRMSAVCAILFLGGWDPGIPLALTEGWLRWVGFFVLMGKVFILLFNLVPYLALRLVGWTHGI